MKYSVLKNILKKHKLRITDGRIDILNFFNERSKALSFKDLEEQFPEYDRVTMYRTLNAFTDNGILHKIPDDSGFATYGLCPITCTEDEHVHNHIHFKCFQCGGIECLDKELPTISLDGYHISEANMILNGTCSTCLLAS